MCRSEVRGRSRCSRLKKSGAAARRWSSEHSSSPSLMLCVVCGGTGGRVRGE